MVSKTGRFFEHFNVTLRRLEYQKGASSTVAFNHPDQPTKPSKSALEHLSGTVNLEAILREGMAGFSRAERRLATYFLNNMTGLQFETGASLAQAVGVSEMTVSRFVRVLGFENLRALKRRIRPDIIAQDGDVDDYMARFQVRGERREELRDSLRMELDAIVKAYSLTDSAQWDEAAVAIEKARVVYVLGFQASKGLAMDFASRLLWMRPNVIFVNSDSGTYGEVLMADPTTSVVVMVDTATYAARAIKLADRLKAIGMPLVIITDKFSLWGWSYSKWVFEAHTYVKTFWDSTAGISVISNLMLDSVAARLGPKAKANYQRMADAGKLLGEFVSKHTLGSRG